MKKPSVPKVRKILYVILYELFKGVLTLEQHERSESSVNVYISEKVAVKPHLQWMLSKPPVSEADFLGRSSRDETP
jgi:hypothetical protein